MATQATHRRYRRTGGGQLISMTRRLLVFLALFPFLPLGAQQAPPDIEQSMVVTGQGYFPVALRLKDGRIAAVLRGGGPHLSIHGRLDIVFSSDDGRILTQPALVASDPAADVRNPAFGQSAEGA